MSMLQLGVVYFWFFCPIRYVSTILLTFKGCFALPGKPELSHYTMLNVVGTLSGKPMWLGVQYEAAMLSSGLGKDEQKTWVSEARSKARTFCLPLPQPV